MSAPDRTVFVLGCQRSGTTWLANVFDASPDVRLYMEPFAAPHRLVPEMPDAAFFLESAPPELVRLLREDMFDRLDGLMSLFARSSLHSPRWFRVERSIARSLQRFGRWVPSGLRQRVSGFVNLNLNRMHASVPLYVKHREPAIRCMKELRLAGKIPLLTTAFPSAHFVAIVRHPCANVHSILKWFERGRLHELRRDLATWLDKLESQHRGDAYARQIERCRRGGLEHLVALYWRVCNETMFEQLEKHAGFVPLVYEELAAEPTETIRGLWSRLGIPWSSSVEAYLAHSRGGGFDPRDPIVTVRGSSASHLEWRHEIEGATRSAVEEITDGSPLLERFELKDTRQPVATG